jgi:hypothetical protein
MPSSHKCLTNSRIQANNTGRKEEKKSKKAKKTKKQKRDRSSSSNSDSSNSSSTKHKKSKKHKKKQQASSSDASGELAAQGRAYSGKYFSADKLRSYVTTYASMPLLAVMEALHIIDSARHPCHH